MQPVRDGARREIGHRARRVADHDRDGAGGGGVGMRGGREEARDNEKRGAFAGGHANSISRLARGTPGSVLVNHGLCSSSESGRFAQGSKVRDGPATEAVLVCELNTSVSQNVILCDVSGMALLSD